MPTITRRAALAGAAALPLAGVAADVQAFPHLADDDPAIAAAQRWRETAERWIAAIASENEAEEKAATIAEFEALDALGSTTATTVEGLRCQFVALVYMVGECRRDGDPFNPEDYTLGHFGDFDHDTRMAHALSRGLRQLGRIET